MLPALLLLSHLACDPKADLPDDTGPTETGLAPDPTDYTTYWNDRANSGRLSIGPYDESGALGVLVNSTILTPPFTGGDLQEAPILEWGVYVRWLNVLLPDVTGDGTSDVVFRDDDSLGVTLTLTPARSPVVGAEEPRFQAA